MLESTLEQARKAYQKEKGEGNPTVPANVPSGTPQELASLGYAIEARQREIRKTPTKLALSNVLRLIDQGILPKSLRPMVEKPPSREDMRYLPQNIQILVDDLSMLNQIIEAFPNVEREVKDLKNQKDEWTHGAIEAGITDKQATVNNLSYPHTLEAMEKSLTKFATEKDAIIRGASSYATNNPDVVKTSTDLLATLAKELQSPMPYSEAKSGIPVHRKSTRQWLDDIREKASLEDRLQARKVLDDAGIDYKGILDEVEKQKLNPVDRAVAEALEKVESEAGSIKKE